MILHEIPHDSSKTVRFSVMEKVKKIKKNYIFTIYSKTFC